MGKGKGGVVSGRVLACPVCVVSSLSVAAWKVVRPNSGSLSRSSALSFSPVSPPRLQPDCNRHSSNTRIASIGCTLAPRQLLLPRLSRLPTLLNNPLNPPRPTPCSLASPSVYTHSHSLTAPSLPLTDDTAPRRVGESDPPLGRIGVRTTTRESRGKNETLTCQPMRQCERAQRVDEERGRDVRCSATLAETRRGDEPRRAVRQYGRGHSRPSILLEASPRRPNLTFDDSTSNRS